MHFGRYFLNPLKSDQPIQPPAPGLVLIKDARFFAALFPDFVERGVRVEGDLADGGDAERRI